MKTSTKIVLATGLLAAAALLVYAGRRYKNNNNMLSEISDEGYETAPDIMFPGRKKKDDNLKYGPVLPA